jgi:hypothetical protein
LPCCLFGSGVLPRTILGGWVAGFLGVGGGGGEKVLGCVGIEYDMHWCGVCGCARHRTHRSPSVPTRQSLGSTGSWRAPTRRYASSHQSTACFLRASDRARHAVLAAHSPLYPSAPLGSGGCLRIPPRAKAPMGADEGDHVQAAFLVLSHGRTTCVWQVGEAWIEQVRPVSHTPERPCSGNLLFSHTPPPPHTH